MPSLNWLGKKAIEVHHKEVPYHLLSAIPDLSVGDSSAENILIHGDNLLALKALLPFYSEEVKLIYIDPPYNTGNEQWVFNDAVNSPVIREWLGKVVGGEADDLSRHDKWLCMMYPRLLLLRRFLREDGLIFISIGKDEIGHLRLIADEIFKPKNLVEVLIWNNEGHTENQEQITTVHEYILVYAKDITKYSFQDVVDPNVPDDSKIRRSFAENSITKNGYKNPASVVTLPVGFPCEIETLYINKFDAVNSFQTVVGENGGWISREISQQFSPQYPIKMDDLVVENSRLIKECRMYSGWSSLNKLNSFIDNNCEPLDDNGTQLSYYLSKNGVIYYRREDRVSKYIQSVLRNMGTTETNKYDLEAMGIDFDYPKPKELIKYIIRICSSGNDIVLDSFAGSGTTAHAVLEQNSEDGNNRRFITIELDNDIFLRKTYKRIKMAIEGFIPSSGRNKDRAVVGLKGGFKTYSLGQSIFSADGQINKDIDYLSLAKFIFFLETGKPLLGYKQINGPFLGEVAGTGVYLLYNGVLNDKAADSGNVLTYEVLKNIYIHSGPKVVYGQGCQITETKLTKMNIVFRQIPYQINIR